MLFKPGKVPCWVFGSCCWVFSLFPPFLLSSLKRIWLYRSSFAPFLLLWVLYNFCAYDVYGCRTLRFFLHSETMVCAYTKYNQNSKQKSSFNKQKPIRCRCQFIQLVKRTYGKCFSIWTKYVRQYNPIQTFFFSLSRSLALFSFVNNNKIEKGFSLTFVQLMIPNQQHKHSFSFHARIHSFSVPSFSCARNTCANVFFIASKRREKMDPIIYYSSKYGKQLFKGLMGINFNWTVAYYVSLFVIRTHEIANFLQSTEHGTRIHFYVIDSSPLLSYPFAVAKFLF